jgi:hypothetical protein
MKYKTNHKAKNRFALVIPNDEISSLLQLPVKINRIDSRLLNATCIHIHTSTSF